MTHREFPRWTLCERVRECVALPYVAASRAAARVPPK
jgi:hypothetical protein